MNEKSKQKGIFYHAQYTLLGIGCLWYMDSSNRKVITKFLYRIYSEAILFIMIGNRLLLCANVPALFFDSTTAIACVTLSNSLYATAILSRTLYARSNLGMKTIRTAIFNERKIILGEDTATRQIYMHQLESSHRLNRAILQSHGFLRSFFCIAGVIIAIIENEQIKKNPDLKRTEVINFWYPLNQEQRERHHAWLTAHQVVFTLISSVELDSAILINNCLMTYFKARIKMLQWRFRNISNVNTISQLHYDHVNLIKEIETYNQVNSGIALLEYFFFATTLGTAMFPLTEGVDTFRSGVVPTICTAHILLVTINADGVLSESLKLSDALYESKWYNEKSWKYVKSMLCFMIMRCQKPLSITMGPFGPLTAITGFQQLKMAYSYVSVLTSTKQQEPLI